MFKAYRQSKVEQNVVDFDDLLRLWAVLLKRPAPARDIGNYFDHVLVDDYQDTNALQAVILKRLKPTGTGVTVVGDDAQAIYGFRAAKARNLRDFQAAFTRPAQVIKLEQNYRSTPPILAASNAVIGLAREGIPKTLRATRIGDALPVLMVAADEQEQAAYIADQVQFKGRGGKKLKDQAVLFRAASHSAQLEIELMKRKIPFIMYGGQHFAEAKCVNDVVALLKWAENPLDRLSGYRALRLMPGFTPSITTRLLDQVTKSGLRPALASFAPPLKAVGIWPHFKALMVTPTCGAIGWQQEVDTVCTWYQAYFERKPDAVAQISRDLARLTSAAAAFDTRLEFIATMMLDPDTLECTARASAHNGDVLTLSTVHQAKGRDWKHVYVLNVIDRCFPDGRANRKSEIEEERRVLYVAMTRAKDQLTMVMPRKFGVTAWHQARAAYNAAVTQFDW